MKTPSNSIFVVAAMVILGGLAASGVFAASTLKISFPVKELGNCADEKSCRTYCDQPENIPTCAAFAAKHDLISEKRAEKSKKLAELMENGGPGGCTTAGRCQSYCENPIHTEECIAFGKRHGLLDDDETVRARKVAQTLRRADQFPGGCADKKSCESYCAVAEHSDECLAFAERVGLMSVREATEARRASALIERGEGPGACATKEGCREYCSETSHAKECAAFAVKAGFLKQEEAERFQKTKGRGPGGCQDRESCEAYCGNPKNQDACLKFAREHEILDEEAIKHLKEQTSRPKESPTASPAPATRKQHMSPTISPNIELQRKSEEPQENRLSPEEIEKLRNSRGFSTSAPEPRKERPRSESSLRKLMGAVIYYLIGR